MLAELTPEAQHRVKQCLTQLDLYLLRLHSAVGQLENLGLKEEALPLRAKVGDLAHDIRLMHARLRQGERG
jgi:hypothetical protein